MPKVAQQDISGQMANLGMARSGIATQRSRLETAAANPESKPKTREKAANRVKSLEAIGPHLRDAPITHTKATNARVRLVEEGAQRALSQGTDPKHDWYFQHHGRLAEVAAETGHDRYAVIGASAVMSPQNNPEQELAAVSALARGHANPEARITVSPQAVTAASHIEGGSVDLSEYQGRALHPSSFSAEHLAALSDTGVRGHVQASGIDLGEVAKGGVKGNVTQAINVLRGSIDPKHAIDPRTSPKVWSYHKNIAESVHGTPEHEEFIGRMRHASGMVMPGQQRMDVFGLREATHGPLNPTNTTAEDTWQQAISTGQRLESVDVPGRGGRAARQSPAKFSVGEGGQANQKFLQSPQGMQNVGASATMHAWQNQATQRAAAILSKRSGEVVPAIGVQAGGWTEARRKASKNIEEHTPLVQPRGPQPVQHALFTETGEITPQARPLSQQQMSNVIKKRNQQRQGSLFD
jgi:hypothetical protein